MIQIVLPWPPSINNYWRSYRGRVVISAKGRAWLKEAEIALLEQRIPRDRISHKLSVSIDQFPPDRRRRDIDNPYKVAGDLLVKAGVIEDDSLIYSLSMQRFDPEPPGKFVIRIKPYEMQDMRV